MSQKLIDDVIIPQNSEPLMRILLLMLVMKVLREGLRYLMVVILETDSQNMMFHLRTRLFERMQMSDMRFFDSHRTGDLMTRMSADLDWCRHFMSYLSYRVIDSVCTFLFATVYLLTVNWRMTLLLVAITPMLLLITKLFSSHVRPKFVAMRERLSEMNTAAQENIAGNRVVKAFAREDYEMERFREKNEAFKQSHLKINQTWLTFFPIMELLANAMMLLTVFVGGIFIIRGDMTPGQMAIFTSLSWALSNPMRELGNLINDMQRFSTSCQKVMELDFGKPSIVDPPGAREHGRMKGKIEFRDVSFAYGERISTPNLLATYKMIGER